MHCAYTIRIDEHRSMKTSIYEGVSVVVGTEDLRETVRRRYAEAAVKVTAGGSGCCANGAVTTLELDETFGSALYTQLDRSDLPVAALAASLGCGNPTAV